MNSTVSTIRSELDNTLGSKSSDDHDSNCSTLLTDGQASAIEADPYLPLAVVAGAGCGKTFTLVRRVARLVKSTGCQPSSVVVLTFSRKACNELLSKLAEAGLKGVSCFTFHAFALRLVRQFGEGSERRAATSSGTQHMKIVQACLDRWYQKQQGGKGEASNFVDSVHGSISGAAETATDQLSTRAAAERSAVARRLGRVIDSARAKHVPSTLGAAGGLSDPCAAYVYHAYSNYREQQRNATTGTGKHHEHAECLREDNECGADKSTISMRNIEGSSGSELQLDFAELVPRALEVLVRPAALAAAQQVYGFGFVDEFQDTSAEQFELLTALWGRPNTIARDNTDSNTNSCTRDNASPGASTSDGLESSSSIGHPLSTHEHVYGHELNGKLPRRGSVTVVGDDDQMIYGWRDAMPNAFKHFGAAFGQPKLPRNSPKSNGRKDRDILESEVPTVRLDINFRTKSSLLLDAASSVVEPIVGRTARARLRPFNALTPGGSIASTSGTRVAKVGAAEAPSIAPVGTVTATVAKVNALLLPVSTPSEGVIDSCLSSSPSSSLSLPSSSSSSSSSSSTILHSSFSSFTAPGRSFGASKYVRPNAFRGPEKTTLAAPPSNEVALNRKRGRGLLLNGVSSQQRFKTFKPPAPTRPLDCNNSNSTDRISSNGSSCSGSLGLNRLPVQAKSLQASNAYSFAPPPLSSASEIWIEDKNSHPGIVVAPNSARRDILELVLPKGGALAPLQWCMLPNEELELEFVAAQISALLRPPATKGEHHSSDRSSTSSSSIHGEQQERRPALKASQVAVLSRNGVNVLPALAKRLADLSIPATILGDGSSNDSESGATAQGKFLQRKPIVDALAFLQLICDEQDYVAARRCLKLTKGLGPKFEAALDEAASSAAGSSRHDSQKKSSNQGDKTPAAAEPQVSSTMPLMGAARRALACFEERERPSSSSSVQGQATLFSRREAGSTSAITSSRDRAPPALALKRGQAAGLRRLVTLLDDSWSQLYGNKNQSNSSDAHDLSCTDERQVTEQGQDAKIATGTAPDNTAPEIAGLLSSLVASVTDFLFPALAAGTTARSGLEDEESKCLLESEATHEGTAAHSHKTSENAALLSTLGQAADAFAAHYFSTAGSSTLTTTGCCCNDQSSGGNPDIDRVSCSSLNCSTYAAGSSTLTTTGCCNDQSSSSSSSSSGNPNIDRVSCSSLKCSTYGSSNNAHVDDRLNAPPSVDPRSRGAWLRCLKAFLLAAADRNLPTNPAIFVGSIESKQSSSGSVGSSETDMAITGKVSLGTIHKSKGLEWDYVFVLRCSDGGSGGLPSLMPDDDLAATNQTKNLSKCSGGVHSRSGILQPQSLVRSEESKLEEERRLLHVALTRAREVCAVSCALEDSYGRPRQPSRFLDDIPSHCVRISTITEEEVSCAVAIADARPHGKGPHYNDGQGGSNTGFATAASQIAQGVDFEAKTSVELVPSYDCTGSGSGAHPTTLQITPRRQPHMSRTIARPRCPIHYISLTTDDRYTNGINGCSSNGNDSSDGTDDSSNDRVSWLTCGFRDCSHREEVGLVSDISLPTSGHQAAVGLNGVHAKMGNYAKKPSTNASSRTLNNFFSSAIMTSATTPNPFVAEVARCDDDSVSCKAVWNTNDGASQVTCDLTLPISPSVSLPVKHHESPKCMHGAGSDCTACAGRKTHYSAVCHNFSSKRPEGIGPEKRFRDDEDHRSYSCSSSSSSNGSNGHISGIIASDFGTLPTSSNGDKSSSNDFRAQPRTQKGKSPPRRSPTDHRARAIAKIDIVRHSFCSYLLTASKRGSPVVSMANVVAASGAAVDGCDIETDTEQFSRLCTSKPTNRNIRRPVKLLSGQQRISAASFFKPRGNSRSPPQERASRLFASSLSTLACAPPPQAPPLESFTPSETATRLRSQENGVATSRFVTVGQKVPCSSVTSLQRTSGSSSIDSDENCFSSNKVDNSNCGSIDQVSSSTTTTSATSRSTVRSTLRSQLKEFSPNQLTLQQKKKAPSNMNSAIYFNEDRQADVQGGVLSAERVFSDD